MKLELKELIGMTAFIHPYSSGARWIYPRKILKARQVYRNGVMNDEVQVRNWLWHEWITTYRIYPIFEVKP